MLKWVVSWLEGHRFNHTAANMLITSHPIVVQMYCEEKENTVVNAAGTKEQKILVLAW